MLVANSLLSATKIFPVATTNNFLVAGRYFFATKFEMWSLNVMVVEWKKKRRDLKTIGDQNIVVTKKKRDIFETKLCSFEFS